MLKKLWRKFIAIAMLWVSIVLIAIVGTINIANYISTNEALDARLKQIVGNGGTFPDLLEQKNMGVESNKIDSINAENTNTGTESTNTDTEKANTDTFGNTADESTNKGTPTLKEPPSGWIDVQPPEDMNL